jgi:geranylgeranyl diphosphate synthase type I
MNATPVPSGATIDTEHADYLAAVAAQLDGFLAEKHEFLEQLSPATLVLVESIKTLVTGGKRMRAMLCYWGWRGP